jgi:predicted secreted hydrolase
MDHEFSTSALARGQVGWDWFSLQLSDGSDLMVFQIRREDGGISPYSSGTLVGPDGLTQALDREEFEIEFTGTWRSPRSGAVYPAGWVIRVPGEELTLEVEPLLADQEMDVSYRYWEGAVSVRGQAGGNPVSGRGYVELTGYAGSLEGEF